MHRNLTTASSFRKTSFIYVNYALFYMDVSAKYLLAWIEICRAIDTWIYLAAIFLNSHLNSDSTSISQMIYCTCAIITRSWFENTLNSADFRLKTWRIFKNSRLDLKVKNCAWTLNKINCFKPRSYSYYHICTFFFHLNIKRTQKCCRWKPWKIAFNSC